jgi:hypothetical protein
MPGCEGDIHLIPAGVEHQPLDIGNLKGWSVGFEPLLLRSLGPEWLPEAPRSSGGAKRPGLEQRILAAARLAQKARRRRADRAA